MTGLGGPNIRKPESSSSKVSTRRADRWAELSSSPYERGLQDVYVAGREREGGVLLEKGVNVIRRLD